MISFLKNFGQVNVSSNLSPAGQKRFSKTFGWPSAASSTTNYRSLSFINSAGVAIAYFDLKTARGSVDCGMCLRAWLR